MESEALTKIRTMRQVKRSLDMARNRGARTTNSLYQNNMQIQPMESSADMGLRRILDKERRRFAAQEASVNKSRKQLLALRKKLAQTIGRNRALTELRLELQRSRLQGSQDNASRKAVEPGAAQSQTGQKLHRMGFKY